MLTPREKRQYELLAAKLRGPKIKITGNAVNVGRQKLQLPTARPTQSAQNDIF
jgi:hypothetical protein